MQMRRCEQVVFVEEGLTIVTGIDSDAPVGSSVDYSSGAKGCVSASLNSHDGKNARPRPLELHGINALVPIAKLRALQAVGFRAQLVCIDSFSSFPGAPGAALPSPRC